MVDGEILIIERRVRRIPADIDRGTSGKDGCIPCNPVRAGRCSLSRSRAADGNLDAAEIHCDAQRHGAQVADIGPLGCGQRQLLGVSKGAARRDAYGRGERAYIFTHSQINRIGADIWRFDCGLRAGDLLQQSRADGVHELRLGPDLDTRGQAGLFGRCEEIDERRIKSIWIVVRRRGNRSSRRRIIGVGDAGIIGSAGPEYRREVVIGLRHRSLQAGDGGAHLRGVEPL